jgi:hypothetical protein
VQALLEEVREEGQGAYRTRMNLYRYNGNGKPVTKKENSTAKANAKALAAAPPPSAFAGTQLSLFQAFLCNTDEERDQLSNTIELWDSIPKYAISQQAMNLIRTKEGLLPRLEKTFVYRKHEYRVRVTPAILDAEGGKGDRAYYKNIERKRKKQAPVLYDYSRRFRFFLSARQARCRLSTSAFGVCTTLRARSTNFSQGVGACAVSGSLFMASAPPLPRLSVTS